MYSPRNGCAPRLPWRQLEEVNQLTNTLLRTQIEQNEILRQAQKEMSSDRYERLRTLYRWSAQGYIEMAVSPDRTAMTVIVRNKRGDTFVDGVNYPSVETFAKIALAIEGTKVKPKSLANQILDDIAEYIIRRNQWKNSSPRS